MHGSHSHSRSWQEAGWETCQVNTERRTVRFERRGKSKPSLRKPKNPAGIRPDLWEQALEITGIKDKDQLVEAALQSLIQAHAGQQLADLGGTIPDIKAPPRRRFKW